MEPFILYEDNHLLGIYKPPRFLSQPDVTGDLSIWEWSKNYLKEKYNKKGNVYLGLLHRLDRGASGILLFAKTSKAAARLSAQFREKTIIKKYWTAVSPIPPQKSGKLEELEFHSYLNKEGICFCEVQLFKGNKHQIRKEFAKIGSPILGDIRYGSSLPYLKKTIALVAYQLSFSHPIQKDRITLTLEDRFRPERVFS